MAITTKALQQLVNRFAGQRVEPMSAPVPCLQDDGIYGPNTKAGIQSVLTLIQRSWVMSRLALPRSTGGIWGTTYPWEPYASKLSAVTAGKFAEYITANWNNKVGTASNLPVGEFLLHVANVVKAEAPAGCTGAAPSGGGGGGGGLLPPQKEAPPPPTKLPDAPLDIFGVQVSRPVAYAAGGVLLLLVGALVLKRKRAPGVAGALRGPEENAWAERYMITSTTGRVWTRAMLKRATVSARERKATPFDVEDVGRVLDDDAFMRRQAGLIPARAVEAIADAAHDRWRARRA